MVRFLVMAVAAMAAPSQAEVLSATSGGFAVEAKATVPVPPTEAYAALGRIGRWWNSGHTYSGDAANMRLELRVDGCFCEAIPDGAGEIEHGRVIYVRPGQTLRVQGGLGPLQSEGVLGTLTWQLRAVEGGTEITQTYVVGGYMRGGFEAAAPLVDQVMTAQLEGLRRHLAR